MIKAVIFDMDGLMIDSELLQSKSFEEVLRNYGVSPKIGNEGIIQIVGLTAKDNWKILRNRYQLNETLEVLIEKKSKIYRKLLSKKIEPKNGLFSLIKKLKKKGLVIAIASSSRLDHINLVLMRLNISNYFNAVISGESVTHGKPYPDIYLEMAKRLKILPNYCLVLEDAQSGVEAAKRAGMNVIAVPDNYTKDQDFSSANMIVSSLKEIKLNQIYNL